MTKRRQAQLGPKGHPYGGSAVIVQKLETEDTLTGLTDVEEKAYVGALPNEDQ